MAESLFTIAFDQRSLAEIALLSQFSTFLEPEVNAALKDSGDLLVAASVANTESLFANPTGELASTIQSISQSPWEIIVGSDSPYAHRRNDGFVGTDSLGRHYNDRPYPFLTNAFDDNQQAILQRVDDGVARALARLSGGGNE